MVYDRRTMLACAPGMPRRNGRHDGRVASLVLQEPCPVEVRRSAHATGTGLPCNRHVACNGHLPHRHGGQWVTCRGPPGLGEATATARRAPRAACTACGARLSCHAVVRRSHVAHARDVHVAWASGGVGRRARTCRTTPTCRRESNIGNLVAQSALSFLAARCVFMCVRSHAHARVWLSVRARVCVYVCV
jgi:hypothetical protein